MERCLGVQVPERVAMRVQTTVLQPTAVLQSKTSTLGTIFICDQHNAVLVVQVSETVVVWVQTAILQPIAMLQSKTSTLKTSVFGTKCCLGGAGLREGGGAGAAAQGC